MNQSTALSPDRIIWAVRNRFNPIRNLTPELLASQLENFQLGYIRDAALTWDAMERRDLTIKNVAMKRKKSVARNGWEILTVDDSPEAQQHKLALEYFYNNLTATNVIEQDQNGGLSLLLRQMMDSVGKYYAVHEIVWKPQSNSGAEIIRPKTSADGQTGAYLDSFLTAEFRFVPLWFFENRQGKLRFLQQDFAVDGVDMPAGDWMVTVGDGLMEGSSVAYMFKHLPLRDWLSFSEKFGMPGVLGKTDAAKDTQEWNALKEAVEAFGQDWAAICNRSAEIDLVEVKNQGSLPYPTLVEEMNRAIASLWRGADLATISKGEGTGASLQADEGDLLLEDDLVNVEETLNERASKWCIYYQFGTKRSLAYISLCRPQKKNIEQDIAVDSFLLNSGVPVAVDDVLERYERPRPEEGEDLLTAPAPQLPGVPGDPAQKKFGNVVNPATVVNVHRLAAAFAEDLQPLRDRIARILEIEDPDLLRSKLEALVKQLPQLLKDINADPESARVLEDQLHKGLLAGITNNPS